MATVVQTVVIRWNDPEHTDYDVVNENWGVLDTGLPPSLGPDLECLVPYIPYPVPDYDPRLYKHVTVKQPTTDPHPVYTTQNQWLITYELERQPDEFILSMITSYENMANEDIFPNTKYKKLNIIALNAIRKYAQGLSLTPFEVNLFQQIAQISNAFYANHVTGEDYAASLPGGGTPNLDEGFVKTV